MCALWLFLASLGTQEKEDCSSLSSADYDALEKRPPSKSTIPNFFAALLAFSRQTLKVVFFLMFCMLVGIVIWALHHHGCSASCQIVFTAFSSSPLVVISSFLYLFLPRTTRILNNWPCLLPLWKGVTLQQLFPCRAKLQFSPILKTRRQVACINVDAKSKYPHKVPAAESVLDEQCCCKKQEADFPWEQPEWSCLLIVAP